MGTDERPGDEKELHWGEKISVASAILLFVFMFFDWFGSATSKSHFVGNAWQTLHIFPTILVLAVLATFLVIGGVFGGSFELFGEREPKSVMVVIAGTVAAIQILGCIVLSPKLTDFSGTEIATIPQLGVFLSLAAAVGIAFGGFQTARAEMALARSEETGDAKSVDDGSTEPPLSDAGDESDDKGENGPLLG